ncbi:unnamed protein product [Rotaria sordida]|uniref:Protein quiver n=1 Tax=Rotaria sordida TaxID=392033 RepID=A0A815NTN4_9BILA|nr:unnamed protein product [Rotaria sordida]CAF1635290.1 unnamed protein product [Rotaria sordida]
MFRLQQTAFIFFLLLAFIQLIDGLSCYSCVGEKCDDPFRSNNIEQITVPDNEGYSCAKYWSPETVVTPSHIMRQALKFCIPNNVLGVGVFCCSTNLCNDAIKMISLPYFIFSLLLIIILLLY